MAKTVKLALMSSLGLATTATVTAAATASTAPHRPERAQREQPNMVLFIADDCTFENLGCYGSRDSRTPNIDRLASQGMTFERAYQSSSVSSPTRHNLYTGLWPMKTGAYPNHTRANDGTLSIVHHLQPAGYRVALAGKSHVGPDEVFPWNRFIDFNKGVELDFDEIDNFIAQCENDDTPFCLFVASSEPHSPWNKGDASQLNPATLTLPPMWVDTPQTRQAFARHLAEVNHMDAQVGRVMDILDSHGATDNSLLLFTSEQGNSFPFAKWTCYDQGVHTAMIVRWPGVVAPASRSDAIVEYVDVVPTFIEAAGADPLGPLDGKSLVPVLKGRKKSHKRYTFSQHTSRGIYSGPEYYGTRSVADSRWRYIVNFTPEVAFQNTETNGKLFKQWEQLAAQGDSHAAAMTRNYRWRPARELYDTSVDPYCMNNLADDPAHAKHVARLDRELRRWMEQCGDRGQATEMEALEHQVAANTDNAAAGHATSDNDIDAASRKATIAAIRARDRAVLVKNDIWIRDPYIVLGPDDNYYLTGTTRSPAGDTEANRYNTGLGDSTAVGDNLRVWRSRDMVSWRALDAAYSVSGRADIIKPDNQNRKGPKWLLWAPELHWDPAGKRWVMVHCPAWLSSLATTTSIGEGAEWVSPSERGFFRKHDPSLFRDDDGTWYLVWANTMIAPVKADFSGLAAEPMSIDPADRKIGHEGALMRKIAGKYVHFGTAWSTDSLRHGSYNLYYCVSDSPTGPFSERRFVGRFLGHGTPFQDRDGNWWCTAFYNANVPPLPAGGIETRNLSDNAYTINEQGVTIVPLTVEVLPDGDLRIRATDPRYATPGPDEAWPVADIKE
jgi:uncharacterized sulfatase